MTVSSEQSQVPYVGDGSTKIFPIPFYFLENTHIKITMVDLLGNSIPLVQNIDYTVSGAGNQTGGSATLSVAPPNLTSILIYRLVPATQLTDYQPNDDFPAESHERALDKLTMLVQQVSESDSRALRHPRDSEHYQAESRRIVNLEDPVDLQDAATKNWALTALAQIISNLTGNPNLASNVFYQGPDGLPYTVQSLSGDNGGFLIGLKGPGVGEVSTSVGKLLLETVRPSRFGAKHDGVTDDTAAINRAIYYLAVVKGGGKLVFPADVTTKVLGKILLPSNVEIDGSWSKMIGASSTVGVFFESAYINMGAIVTNIGTAIESHIVRDSSVHNFRFENVGQIFNFFNFTIGAGIHDITHTNVRQVGKFERCFYPLMFNISGSGGSDASVPCFYFKDQANAVKFLNVQTTMEYGLFVEGSGAVIDLDNWRFEGGSKGCKLSGEIHAFSWHGCYFEAVPGTLFDFSACTFLSIKAFSNYYNLVDIVMFDGASQTAGPTIFGTFDETNEIVNVGGVSGGITYRGRMEINAIRNFAKYTLQDDSQAVLSIPANWITGINTNIERVVGWTGASVSDFRQKSRYMGNGIIPLYHGGDVGQAFTGSVPFCTVTSSGATVNVLTRIVWRPDSLFADFTFTVQDANGPQQVFGRVYGANADKRSTGAITVTAVNNGGFLQLVLGIATSLVQITGTVKISA